MKHAILGAGAIGGLMGTALAHLGDDVTMIVRPEKLSGYPQTLTLERPSGALTASAKAVSRLTDPADVLWIATKTYQLEAALEMVEAMPTIVVPLLNGVDHIAVLRARFGHESRSARDHCGRSRAHRRRPFRAAFAGTSRHCRQRRGKTESDRSRPARTSDLLASSSPTNRRCCGASCASSDRSRW